MKTRGGYKGEQIVIWGPTLAHSLRMRLLLLLILPFLNGRSIVRERNDVIKQALIPTLVNIIRHARMAEHGKRQTQKQIKM